MLLLLLLLRWCLLLVDVLFSLPCPLPSPLRLLLRLLLGLCCWRCWQLHFHRHRCQAVALPGSGCSSGTSRDIFCQQVV
jgi:hypothetical protein